MDQLIHIVLHHIPPVIPMDDANDTGKKTFDKSEHLPSMKSIKQALGKDEEIKAIERKMAFLKELVMAQGRYRQNLLKSLKTAVTLNTTFLILSHLSV